MRPKKTKQEAYHIPLSKGATTCVKESEAVNGRMSLTFLNLRPQFTEIHDESDIVLSK